MGLIHIDAPRCLGNCEQGTKKCTWPGVCQERAHTRVSEADLVDRQLERLCVAEAALNIAAERVTGKPADARWLTSSEVWAWFAPALVPLLAVAIVAALLVWGGA